MKRIISFFIPFLFFFFLFFPFVLAHPEEESVASPSSEREETVEGDYQLPYPGMLPDHPLYKLKVLRDKIVLFLIRDPLKKAAKHLYMADKEFMMALKLAEKDRIPLAQHTAFKAEHHMTLLVAEIKTTYYTKRELNKALVNKAHQAALKHQELLAGMMERADEKGKEAFQIIKEFSIRNDNSLSSIEEEVKEQEELKEEVKEMEKEVEED